VLAMGGGLSDRFLDSGLIRLSLVPIEYAFRAHRSGPAPSMCAQNNATGFMQADVPLRGTAPVAPAFRRACDEDRELSKKIYVGNLPFSTTESELRSLFERHGQVTSVNVIMDRETGRPRGFAFVEMEDANSAATAIRSLDGSQLDGRSIRVNEAQDRREGGGGGGGGFRREGGGGGGGGRRGGGGGGGRY